MARFRTVTLTADGPIPHLRHPRFGFQMPVKLDFPKKFHAQNLAQPLRREGSLVYALPCGGEFVAPL
jgi:hypothetical protein